LDAIRQFLRHRHCVDFVPPQELEQLPEYPAVKEIVSELHSFPLALNQAAAYIRENDPFTYAEYLELLTARREDREVLLRFKEAKPEYPDSVMTTWDISLDYVKTKRPGAAVLLQLLGFLAHSEIPAKSFIEATEEAFWSFGICRGTRQLNPEQRKDLDFLSNRAEFNAHVGFLVSLSLISKDSTNRIFVHPLVHEWIRARLRPYPKDEARFARICISVVYQAYPLHQHAFSVESSGTGNETIKLEQLNPHIWEVLGNFGQYEHEPTPVEVRILALALLLSTMSSPKPRFRAMLQDFVRKYPFLMDLPQDDVGSLQRKLFHAVISPRPFPVSNLKIAAQSLRHRMTARNQLHVYGLNPRLLNWSSSRLWYLQ
jgi:hypothetical protein